MKYVNFGASGLKVSQLCVGCMSFGQPGNTRTSWAPGEEDAQPFFQRAAEAGINFLDAADVYSGGMGEELTSQLVMETLVVLEMTLSATDLQILNDACPPFRRLGLLR
jgi:aryl-alcohol dehydrogenase-like predicted oxidoreductase